MFTKSIEFLESHPKFGSIFTGILIGAASAILTPERGITFIGATIALSGLCISAIANFALLRNSKFTKKFELNKYDYARDNVIAYASTLIISAFI